jgi:aminomethyltransferase
MSKQTALYSVYATQQGIRFVDFGGWNMPVDFGKGIITEHNMVRSGAGLFDVSHMGEFIITGQRAAEFADYLLCNAVSVKKDNSCIYSPMCYEDGGTVDDLMVYKMSSSRLMLVVNASNREKDAEWVKEKLSAFNGSLDFKDVSAETSLLALQGPAAADMLAKLSNTDINAIRPFRFAENCDIAGINCLISRTGYTGEDGFEIYLANNDAQSLWKLLLHEYPESELLPCGLGCRDTLRLEAALPLYGHELSKSITPLEAGLDRFVRLDKEDFIGKDALQNKQIENRLFGCVMTDKAVPRHGNEVFYNNEKIGIVTSGSKSPTLDSFIAMILVKSDKVSYDDTIIIRCSGRDKRAEIKKLPFYRRK